MPKLLICKNSGILLRDTGGIRTPNLLGRNQRHYPIVLRYHPYVFQRRCKGTSFFDKHKSRYVFL